MIALRAFAVSPSGKLRVSSTTKPATQKISQAIIPIEAGLREKTANLYQIDSFSVKSSLDRIGNVCGNWRVKLGSQTKFERPTCGRQQTEQ
jgi:hypothetical protein